MQLIKISKQLKINLVLTLVLFLTVPQSAQNSRNDNIVCIHPVVESYTFMARTHELKLCLDNNKIITENGFKDVPEHLNKLVQKIGDYYDVN